ncbi:MAG: hypothetical protein KDD40_07680, partial [Bdellovibrionales bacterium]|nr:hypothetical protein [Bdellovibrionales bacterium]
SQIINITKGYEGRLHLMKWMVSNFRLLLFSNFLRGLEESNNISGSNEAQQMNLYPMLQALYDHITENEDIPLETFNLDPALFGVNQAQDKNEFANYIKKVDLTSENNTVPTEYFPFKFIDSGQFGRAYQELKSTKLAEPPKRNRKTVISESLTNVETELRSELAAFLRLRSLNDLPSAEIWVKSLKEKDPANTEAFKTRIVDIYQQARRQLYENSLIEVINYENYKSLSAYHSARIFLYIIDRALSKLPWENVINFFSNTMLDIANDMTMSQAPGFQWLLTDSRYSPLRPITNDLLIANLTNFPAFKQSFDDQRQRQKSSFKSDCGKVLE